ncbi:NADP-dependent oxidoreductase [Actinoplanes couchii]|uniref:Oxidoreductase n=1 Tax=Actinoplanes couchii TaxID=403638 RepID=A0ABQ3X5F5_9ACTN|nr:oxidoreductase [Actinoplanes couchii]
MFESYGPPDVLHLTDLPDPVPGPGEVLVRVHAAGVQPFDVAVRQGRMPWVEASFPQQIGQEYAGVVEALGEGVTGLTIGAPVLGSTMLNGAAELLTAPAGNVVAKPAELDFPTAAALVAAAQTASGALAELAVSAGDVLLIHAGAGSVGTVAAQLAGVPVIGTASPRNHDHLRSLGMVPVEYGPDLVANVRATGLRPTVALDAAGGEAIAQSVALGIAPERIGTIVDDKAAAEHGAAVVRAGRSPQRLAAVVARAAAGGIRMRVRPFPLDRIAEAHAEVESRHSRGKVVLMISE